MVSKQKINKYAKLCEKINELESEKKALGKEIKQEMKTDVVTTTSYRIKKSLVNRPQANSALLKADGLFEKYSKISSYYSLSVKKLK